MKNRVWGLDLLRAVAVLGVLLSHIQPHTQVNFFQKLLPVGPIFGVELFFVLSGFLIGQILIREFCERRFEFSAALGFMRRRWYRTLPNYYLFFLITLLIQPVPFSTFAPFLVFFQNAFTKPIAGFYGVTWSLTIEEIFYVSFPLALVFLARFRISINTKLWVTIIAFILFPMLARYFFYDSDVYGNADYRKAVILRLDAIAFGVLFALIKVRYALIWKCLSKQGMWLLFPFWYFFMFNRAPVLKLEDWALIYFPLCSACMATMLPFFDSLKTNVSIFSQPVTFLAAISYSLYLCHIPVIIIVNRYLNTEKLLSGHYLEFVYVCVSILLAYLVFIAWEMPMTRLRDR
jgi:peptidoglycan/LPS O-acetylase OafA/YrhL